MDVTVHLENLPDPKEPIDRDALRELRAQVMKVVSGHIKVRSELADKLSPLCKIIDMSEHAEELDALFADESNSRLTRERALAAVFHTDVGLSRFQSLNPLQRVEFCAPWVRPILRLGATEEFPRVALMALYRATPDEARDALIAMIGLLVAQVGATHQALSTLLRAPLSDAQRVVLDQALEAASC